MPKVDNARLRFLPPDEAKKLLAELNAHHPQSHDMALLSIRAGLRATEIFKLKGQDVDARARFGENTQRRTDSWPGTSERNTPE